MLRNEKGSIMSVAVIMIALLSFALTSVTAYSFRTAENTNRVVSANEATNVSKRLISEAMARFENAVIDLVEEKGDDVISPSRDTDFWDAMLPVVETIETNLNVRISEAEEKIDDALIDLDVGAKAFRFAASVSEDRDMVKYLFLSNYGTEWEAYDAFEYSIGSSSNVVINGGGYNNSTDIYGHYLYNGYSTAYKGSLEDSYSVYSAGTYNYPSGDDLTFVSPNYNYCDVGAENPCLSTDDDGNLIVHDARYSEFDDTESNYFSDLLTGFDYDRTFYSTLEQHLGTDTLLNESNYETYLSNEVEDGKITELSDDTNPSYLLDGSVSPLSDDTVIFQDTVVDMTGGILDLNGHSLIIVGDLHIQSVDELLAPGQVYVFGNLIFENDRDLRTNANFFSTGDIAVSFPRGTGFQVYDDGQNNEGTGFFAGGNIEINHTYTPPNNNGTRFALFMLAQGSIKIDSAIEEFAIGGAIYAQGEGTGLDDVYMKRDNKLEPFKGLIINSFNGQNIDSDQPSPGSYNETPGNNNTDSGTPGVNPGGRPKGNSGKFHDDTEHLFRFSTLTSPGNSSKEDLEESFSNLPDFKQLEITPTEGTIITDTSTFLYEQRKE